MTVAGVRRLGCQLRAQITRSGETEMHCLIAALIVSFFLTAPANAAQHRGHHHVRAVQSQHKIACTVVGCIPVPLGCEPVEGRTPSGIPTGFDVIVCPPGRRGR